MAFSERLQEIKTGFEPAFWIANITEIFERLAYYGCFTFLALFLSQNLKFSTEETTGLTGWFGTSVWFLAIVGGAVADRLGFRRALSLAFLILSAAYFLIGSLATSWMQSLKSVVPYYWVVMFVLFLPALGIALVKPCVVGTTARASADNVRSIGYSIYYTMVNIGSTFGPISGEYIRKYMSIEDIFRLSAAVVFVMFFAVLLFFKEPTRSGDAKAQSLGEVLRNLGTVLTNFRFMAFLLIFSGYWIVFWQQYISLPLYVTRFIDKDAPIGWIIAADPITVISLTVVINMLTRKLPTFTAIIIGTLVSSLGWAILALRPSIWGAVASLVVLALGEIIQSPRYYEYISRLAPPGQQGTYMGFAFVPIGIGSLLGGWFSGKVMHRFTEVQNQPAMVWWSILGVGLLTTVLLFIYDRVVKPMEQPKAA
jgi:proton-dependent oligopeptide transporter, POT family